MKTYWFLLLLGCSVNAYSADGSAIGLFSNMRLDAENLGGVEIFVVYSDDGYYATLQYANGAISPPVVVKAHVIGSNIEFTIPNRSDSKVYQCPPGKFRGKISQGELEGYFQGTDRPGVLKRRKSYWQ